MTDRPAAEGPHLPVLLPLVGAMMTRSCEFPLVDRSWKLLPLVGAMMTAAKVAEALRLYQLLPLVGAMMTLGRHDLRTRDARVAAPRRGDDDGAGRQAAVGVACVAAPRRGDDDP